MHVLGAFGHFVAVGEALWVSPSECGEAISGLEVTDKPGSSVVLFETAVAYVCGRIKLRNVKTLVFAYVVHAHGPVSYTHLTLPTKA